MIGQVDVEQNDQRLFRLNQFQSDVTIGGRHNFDPKVAVQTTLNGMPYGSIIVDNEYS